MDRQQILEEITEAMRALANDDAIVLSEANTAEDVDAWDSLLHVKLIMALEQCFGIRFASREIGEPENVRALIDLIAAKL